MLTAEEEHEFAELPEPLRLLLAEMARQELAERRRRDIALSPAQLGHVADIDPVRLHHDLQIAMIKLQAAASDL